MNANEALERCLKSTATAWGHSRWAEFRACPYGHHLRFVEGVSPRPEAADHSRLDYFDVGQAVHGALAYSALGVIHGFEANWRAPLVRGVREGVWPASEADEARRLVWAYMAKYGAANAGYGSEYRIIDAEPDGWEVDLNVPAEQSLEARRRGGTTAANVKYTTRPDAVLRRRSTTAAPLGQKGHAHRARRLVLVDTKTRSKNYSESNEELSILFKTRPQFLGHVYVAREKLGEIPDLMVNLIIKTKIPDYHRIFVRFTDAELDEWALNHVASLEHRSFDERWKNYSSCVNELTSQKCWAISWCHGGAQDRQKLFQVTRKPSYESDGEKYGKLKSYPSQKQQQKRQGKPTERERETEERHRSTQMARADGRHVGRQGR